MSGSPPPTEEKGRKGKKSEVPKEAKEEEVPKTEASIIERAYNVLWNTQEYDNKFFSNITNRQVPNSPSGGIARFGARRRSYAKVRKVSQRVKKGRRSVKKKYCPKEMTKKPCNPKSDKANDPAYECNPKTGRWVLRKKRSQKKVSPIKALVPSPARSLLTPIEEVPKISSRRSKKKAKFIGPKRKSRVVCQDEDPITGEYIDEIEDVVNIKTDTGDWVCFDRGALIDSMANGPIWFATKTTSDNMQDFIEYLIKFANPGRRGYEKLRNGVIYDLYNRGEAQHIGGFMAHTKNASIVRAFLNKLFTTYRLMEWSLDDKILLSGTSLKYLKDPSITEFHMVKSSFVADEPHTFFGKGHKSDIYLIAPMNIKKIEPIAIRSHEKLKTIVIADHDDLDDIIEKIDELPETEYGKGRIYHIGDIAEKYGIV